MRVPSSSPQVGAVWVAALLWVVTADVRAAAAYSESFGTSASGWTNEGSWGAFGATNGHLQGRFSAIAGPPTPQPPGRFIATNTAAGGAFTGNYDAAGLVLLGFSIYAADVLPADLLVRWYGGDGFAYFRSGLATNLLTTGVWHTLVFSLQDKAAGGWVGSSATNFATARQSVTRIDIQVERNGSAVQTFAVDNIFVDARPAVATDPANAFRLMITPLQSNAAYHVQVAAALTSGAWSNVDLLVATNRWMEWAAPELDVHPLRFFRVTQDDVQF